MFEKGDLLEAIQASFSLTGLLPPVLKGQKVLVDGGAVNPIPFDIIEDCDITIAVNVLGTKTPKGSQLEPGIFDAIFNTYQIMEESIIRQKMLLKRPDIYLKPDIRNVKVLEFHKTKEIYEQTQDTVDELKSELTKLL